jgi:antitoxin component HigA of HigAB toxin-antitoxin module
MTKRRKIIRPVRDDSEYRLALAEIERCFDREQKADPTVETLFDSLAAIIEADERERCLTSRGNRPRKRDGYSSFSVVK